jgi:hypothetical protein
MKHFPAFTTRFFVEKTKRAQTYRSIRARLFITYLCFLLKCKFRLTFKAKDFSKKTYQKE